MCCVMYGIILFENLHFCPSTGKQKASILEKFTLGTIFGARKHHLRMDGRLKQRKNHLKITRHALMGP